MYGLSDDFVQQLELQDRDTLGYRQRRLTLLLFWSGFTPRS